MACRIKNNKAYAKNGEESQLFNKLVQDTGNLELAETIYREIYTNEFKDDFGMDFENNAKALEETFPFTDSNGEPKLIAGDGFYYMIRPADGSRLVFDNIKDGTKSSTDGLSYLEERELIDTAISFVNDARKNNDKFNANSYFNTNNKGKGILAKRILLEGFEGLDNYNTAVELFENNDSIEDLKAALPSGVTLSPNFNDFANVYENWNDEEAPVTGNIIRKGWRGKIQDSLSDYGLTLRDDVGELVDIDDTPIRIHDQSRLEENPRNKMSSSVKAILTDIRSSDVYFNPLLEEYLEKENLTEDEFYDKLDNNEITPPSWFYTLGPNFYGYYTGIPLDEIYQDISEATVDQPEFVNQLAQLQHMAKYKPYLQPVVDKLKRLDTASQAAFYSNFANSYKNFLQFKATKVKDGVEVTMFPSDQYTVSKRYASKWQSNSIERDIPNPDSLYKLDEDGNPFVEDSKKNKIKGLYDKLAPVAKDVRYELNENDTETLADLLWEMNIQYAPTKEMHLQNLTKYFNVGEVNGKSGASLFKSFLFDKASPVGNAVDNIQQDKNIFNINSKLVKRFAKIGPYFETKAASSFLSGNGKSYYPVNLPTTLDEIVNVVQQGGQKFIDRAKELFRDNLFEPNGNPKYRSFLLNSLYNNPDARNNFMSQVLDSNKGIKDTAMGKGYEEQSEKGSLIVRLNAAANNGNKLFTKIASSVQADRGRMDFVTMSKVKSTEARKEIKSIIVQDLARINQARKDIEDANGDITKLIEGYHYKPGTNPFTADTAQTGYVFTMPQITGLDYSQPATENSYSDIAGDMDYYLDTENNNSATADYRKIDNVIEKLVDDVEAKLETYEVELKEEMDRVGVNPATDLHESARKPGFLKDFVLQDFIGRIELAKITRGGYAYAKNGEDFYKRQGLINTPGKKLFIVGNGINKNDTYGMMPTYNMATIKEVGFLDEDAANQVVERMATNLERSVGPVEAARISNEYRPGRDERNELFVKKTDAQGVISIGMYRGIQMGIGNWDMVLDEQAYQNELQGNGYVDNKGNPRPILPVKPYHDELTVRNGIAELNMDKNSYVTLTKDFAAGNNTLEKLRQVMIDQKIQVINEENANKGAIKDSRDVSGSLDNMTITQLDSKNLRLPQITPSSPKNKITFSRQIRKNVIGNFDMAGEYNINGRQVSGIETYNNYHQLIADNIAEDTAKLEKELGITQIENAIKKFSVESKEHKAAKLEHLKKLRDTLKKQLKEKELPENYLDALDIVPDGPYNYRFAVPMAFPNYQAKFEQIYFSLFNNGIFTQKQKGKELVQIAEIGGYELDSDLKMYDGSNLAEVRMRASDLGITKEELQGKTIADFAEDRRLTMLGYRIPNQGKSSMLPMRVVGFLPETHAKGIVVPGGITKQMGSDFDVDKLMIIQRESGENLTDRQLRDQAIFDTMFGIITAPQHLSEVLDPLDSERLENIANQNKETIDYNNPLTEVSMEQKQKAGIRLRGTWANILAGHNVAQAGGLSVSTLNAPVIDGVIYTKLGQVRESVNGEFIGPYNDKTISSYLSAAVDAGKKPIQIELNDNEFTAPVSGMMLSMGIPVETIVNFLNQPAIKEAIQDARNNGYHPGQLFLSARKTLKGMKKKTSDAVADMSSEELTRQDEALQADYLNNFMIFHKAGQSTVRAFKVITPDNLDNVNEMSGLRGWLDVEAEYLSDNDINIVEGAEEYITEMKGTDSPRYGIQVAYRGILNTILKGAERAGFINNRPAFFQFKQLLKNATLKTSFDAATHKFIDRALFLKMMADPRSPLADYMSKDKFNQLLTDPTSNIATRLQELQKDGRLDNNRLFQKLVPGARNNNEGNSIFTVALDTSYDMTAHEKNTISSDFKNMLKDSDVKIRSFAKDLVAMQLMTSGFHPAKGSLMDLIPTEAFTTNMLNEKGDTPARFFNRIESETMGHDFFNDFLHDFVRNYGTVSVGNQNILPTISHKKIKTKDGQVFLNKEANPSIFKQSLGFAPYFVTYDPILGAQTFVLANTAETGGTYVRLQPKGVKGQANEVGSVSQDSAINKEGTGAHPITYQSIIENTVEMPESVEAPLEIYKVCKI